MTKIALTSFLLVAIFAISINARTGTIRPSLRQEDEGSSPEDLITYKEKRDARHLVPATYAVQAKRTARDVSRSQKVAASAQDQEADDSPSKVASKQAITHRTAGSEVDAVTKAHDSSSKIPSKIAITHRTAESEVDYVSKAGDSSSKVPSRIAITHRTAGSEVDDDINPDHSPSRVPSKLPRTYRTAEGEVDAVTKATARNLQEPDVDEATKEEKRLLVHAAEPESEEGTRAAKRFSTAEPGVEEGTKGETHKLSGESSGEVDTAIPGREKRGAFLEEGTDLPPIAARKKRNNRTAIKRVSGDPYSDPIDAHIEHTFTI